MGWKSVPAMRCTTASNRLCEAKTFTKGASEYSGRLIERPLRMAEIVCGVAVIEGKCGSK